MMHPKVLWHCVAIPTSTISMQDCTRTLARYASASKFESLPPAVRHEGVRAFVNWVGCAAGGAHEESVARRITVASEFTGASEAMVVGRRERLAAPDAALVNSLSSAALSFNDTHYATVAHPTSPVAAALLAQAERQPVSGAQFVHALILGVELQCRVGNLLCTPPATCEVGLSMAGLVGGIGAAIAVGKLLELDESAMAQAIGHAANQACGLREAHGSMASHLTNGDAARSGFLAAHFAARGITCTETLLEGPKGFAAAYCEHPNYDAALDKLGQAFEIASLAYKPYPSGFVVHPAIDCCLDVRKDSQFECADIERVELTVNPLAAQLCDRPQPESRNQAFVSMQHWVAAALMYQAAGVAQLADMVIHDPAVHTLRAKVRMITDAAVGTEAADLRIVLHDGSTVRARIRQCRGSAGRPLTDDELTAKARAQLATSYPPPQAEAILAASWRVAELASTAELCAALAVPL
jgi:2-methylcitrate dehydratase PrpD